MDKINDRLFRFRFNFRFGFKFHFDTSHMTHITTLYTKLVFSNPTWMIWYRQNKLTPEKHIWDRLLRRHDWLDVIFFLIKQMIDWFLKDGKTWLRLKCWCFVWRLKWPGKCNILFLENCWDWYCSCNSLDANWNG